jgi:predicted nucleic acid-binding protein
VIVVDTGPIVAAMNDRDQRHAECAELFRKGRGPFFVPGPVLTEVCYLLESRRGPHVEAAFLDSLSRRELELVGVMPRDLARMADLVKTYGDMPLGGVDASVVAVAERLGIRTVATLDRRHFGVVRPRHVDTFELLP